MSLVKTVICWKCKWTAEVDLEVDVAPATCRQCGSPVVESDTGLTVDMEDEIKGRLKRIALELDVLAVRAIATSNVELFEHVNCAVGAIGEALELVGWNKE